jgi:hypothetical protein
MNNLQRRKDFKCLYTAVVRTLSLPPHIHATTMLFLIEADTYIDETTSSDTTFIQKKN